MLIIQETQGSDGWLKVRSTHFTASEAPSMLGLSKYVTREALLRQKATGITKEIDSATQRRFDSGHAAEKLARCIAEEIIDSELFPVTGSKKVNGLPLLASFDGLTIEGTICWENKLWNKDFAAQVSAGIVPDTHWPQIEQQLLVGDVEKALFTVSDGTKENTVSIWYESQPERRAQLLAGWEQFEIDLAAYVPTEKKEMPIAEAISVLPALFIHAKGEITTSNMAEYGGALALQLKSMRAIVLVSDQDFVNAKASAKHLRDSIIQAKAAKEAMLASTVTVGEAAKMIDFWCEDMRVTALQMEQDVAQEDGIKKTSMVQKARIDFSEHVSALNTRLGKPYMPATNPDFAAVMKGKRSYTNMQDAVDTELARAKIAANQVADKLQSNMKEIDGLIVGLETLFPDYLPLVLKDNADMVAVVKNRISEHKASEEKRLEAEREKIRAEEVAKIEKAAADAAKVEVARVAKEAADAALFAERLANSERVEQARQAELAGAALIIRAEAKPEPVATVQKPPLTVVAKSEPVYTPPTTRDSLNMLLGQMSEADLVRTLHFVQQRFFSEVAA